MSLVWEVARWTTIVQNVHEVSMFFPGSNLDLLSHLCVELPKGKEEMNLQGHPDLFLFTDFLGIWFLQVQYTPRLWFSKNQLILTKLRKGR